jgi:hypothetical protein
VLPPTSHTHTYSSTGGLIGFACTHGYPHSAKSAIQTVLENLKGLDMLVYQALRRLSNRVNVLAVVHHDAGSDEEEYEYEDSDGEWRTHSSRPAIVPPAEHCYLTDLSGIVLQDSCKFDKKTKPEDLDFALNQVIWLNGGPNSFAEVAAVFATVSTIL